MPFIELIKSIFLKLKKVKIIKKLVINTIVVLIAAILLGLILLHADFTAEKNAVNVYKTCGLDNMTKKEAQEWANHYTYNKSYHNHLCYMIEVGKTPTEIGFFKSKY